VPTSRILITRSPHQASELAELLRALGADPILIPTIELTDPTTFAPLDAALTNLDTFHWLLFTSANAVQAFHRRLIGTPAKLAVLKGTGFSPSINQPREEGALAPEVCSLPPSLRIAAIGPATARALEAIGLTPTLLPPQPVAESLAKTLLPHALQPDGSPTCFLLIRAEQARDILPNTLRAAGADVTIAPAYSTTIPQASLSEIQTLFSTPANYPDAITFTSSSTATNLLALLEAANLTLPPEIFRISIGPITSQTLRHLHLPPHAEAAEPTLPALVEILVKALNLNNLL
jgi:uroporphyrinogen-III synthase